MVFIMKVFFLIACLTLVASQSKSGSNSGVTFGDFGSPAFDEIVVHSTLTVKGKTGSRGSKSLVSDTKTKTVPLLNTNGTTTTDSNSASISLKRNKRFPRRYGGYFGSPHSSSSAAQASSNSFNHNTPFGNFGASASQSASQSQSYGPNGPQASSGHSSSQSYKLPNGNSIDVSFSGGYSFGNGKPTFSNSHSVTVTKPNGQSHQWGGG